MTAAVENLITTIRKKNAEEEAKVISQKKQEVINQAKQQKSLTRWTKQKWRTPSGKKSSETGEVYAPSKTIKKLKSTKKGRSKLAAANKKKRAATKKGKQHARHGLHKGKKR